MNHIVKIQSLDKSYSDNKKNVTLFAKAELNIKNGQVVALVGGSGSGKTTLLNIIGLLDEFQNGQMIIDNINVTNFTHKKRTEFRKENIGFIFQFHHLIPELNLKENIELPLYIKGKSKKKSHAKSAELIEFFGLKNRETHMSSQLSGGEQQRVAIARALISDAKLILADEPTGNLDQDNSQKVVGMLFDYARNYKKTVVMVTHNLSIAKQCDSVFTIKNKQIIQLDDLIAQF